MLQPLQIRAAIIAIARITMPIEPGAGG
jgi:hypothetical protein